MADLIRNLFPLNPFDPSSMVRAFWGAMLQSIEILQSVTPESNALIAIKECRNKLQAFYLFQCVDSVLDLVSRPNLTLSQMIGMAATLGPFFSVWATEGLGHYYTRLHTRDGQFPQRLLCSADVTDLPPRSLVPLHTGMGLALAESALNQLPDAGTLADRFLELCRLNALPEYLSCAIEAMGLVARNLRPDLIAQLDQEFGRRNEELQAYFWHGVGRGIYFMLVNFLPCWSAPWPGYEMCTQEPAHSLGRLNAASGFAWALTLVNMREPEIVAAFLKRHQARLANDDAFANGLFSALVIWLESAPHDSSVPAFCAYNIEQLDPSLLPLWDRYVRQPAQEALRFRGRSSKAINDLFRYQPAACLLRQQNND